MKVQSLVLMLVSPIEGSENGNQTGGWSLIPAFRNYKQSLSDGTRTWHYGNVEWIFLKISWGIETGKSDRKL